MQGYHSNTGKTFTMVMSLPKDGSVVLCSEGHSDYIRTMIRDLRPDIKSNTIVVPVISTTDVYRNRGVRWPFFYDHELPNTVSPTIFEEIEFFIKTQNGK